MKSIKKKLSVFVISSVIAVSLAGCGSSSANVSSGEHSDGSSTESSIESNAESSTASNTESNAENSTESSTELSYVESSESQPVSSDNTEPEESVVVSSDESTESSESSLEAGQSKYLTMTVYSTAVSKKNMTAQSIDLSSPSVTKITDTKELKEFYEKYKTTYSLDDVDSGQPFSDITADFDNNFFADNDVVVIVQTCDSESGVEVGEAYIDNSELKITVCKNEPSSADKTAYNCSVIVLNKADVGSAKPSVEILPPQM